jgi:hypothetical protein
MTRAHTNELVTEYLQRLERAAAALPRSRRAELVSEIREHIDDALLEAGAADEVAVRNVLERLGTPEDIAAAAGTAQRRSGRRELAALIALAIPFLGWFVGIVLVAASRAWTGREKAIGVGLVLLPAVLLAFGYIADGGSESPVPIEPEEQALKAAERARDAAARAREAALFEEQASSDGRFGPIELVLVLGTFLAGPLASVYLASRLRRTFEPAELASA